MTKRLKANGRTICPLSNLKYPETYMDKVGEHKYSIIGHLAYSLPNSIDFVSYAMSLS